MGNISHFFCYDKNLAIYINKKGYQSVTTALSPSSGKKFTLFVKSEQLQKIIDQYQETKKLSTIQ
ncbi:DUF5659 domain-containing protein [Cytobacillus firmus]|uniref:DUF5659 domain-containing protein n=1 Tax=Cytobacillus firmus TaxID=1399 RepID=UPI003B58A132